MTEEHKAPFSEAVSELQVEPHLLWRWSQRFSLFLSSDVGGDHPHYSSADLDTLRTIRGLLEGGYNDQQIAQHLALQKAGRSEDQTAEHALTPSEHAIERGFAPSDPASSHLSQALRDMFGTLASGQQAVLSNQATVREMLGVIVQDNFNLKDENRKLRERMLEMERALAEYQRREEMRKERFESRLRGVENTVAGLQQQIAQLVQLLRKRRRGFFW